MVDEKKFLDQNGVEYLWSQLSLEDYPNNETLIAVLNAIDQTKADKDELFSGSWNDLEDKPFGEESSAITIFSGNVDMVGQDVADVYFTTGYAPTGLSSIPEEVTITVDGVSTVVAIPGGSFSYNGKNIRADISKGDDGNWSVINFHHGGNNNYTIEDITIEAVAAVVKTIDSKYLPEVYATQEYVDEQLSTKSNSNHEHDELYYTETEVNDLLNNKVNTTTLDNYYTKAEVEQFHDEIKNYVDDEVAALVNSAPETLDTLGELAEAFQENKTVVDALDASITNKQDKISDTLILVDTVTGLQHKIQIQNGQLVSFPVE